MTTCSKAGLDQYGFRWLEGRKNWPIGTDFQFYTEGFEVDCPGKDLRDLAEFSAWKLRHAAYEPPSWQWDVVKYAHKVFAAMDAFQDFGGIGVWLDADCVTHREIPEGLIERQLDGCYLACFQRTGLYTETGLWIVDCSRKEHREFMDTWKSIYLADRFKSLPQWHDCMTLDAAIRLTGAKVKNLSGEFHKHSHPISMTELGRYVDHCKGPRKILGRSPENKFREVA